MGKEMKSLQLDALLSIGHWSNASGGGWFIDIEDAASRAHFVRLEISMEEFAKALASQGSRPCTVEVGGFSVLGKKHECKTELLDVPEGVSVWDKKKCEVWLKKAVKPLEVDGWVAEVEQAMRTQQNTRGKVEVIFRRYV